MSKHRNHCEDMHREARLLKRAIMRTLLPAKAKYADINVAKGGGHLPKEWR